MTGRREPRSATTASYSGMSVWRPAQRASKTRRLGPPREPCRPSAERCFRPVVLVLWLVLRFRTFLLGCSPFLHLRNLRPGIKQKDPEQKNRPNISNLGKLPIMMYELVFLCAYEFKYQIIYRSPFRRYSATIGFFGRRSTSAATKSLLLRCSNPLYPWNCVMTINISTYPRLL